MQNCDLCSNSCVRVIKCIAQSSFCTLCMENLAKRANQVTVSIDAYRHRLSGHLHDIYQFFIQLSGKSFPLCMRQLHQSLRENHHLRHGGRMQYGLFLKGIGLSLEQALQFWRSEFIKGKVDADKVMLTALVKLYTLCFAKHVHWQQLLLEGFCFLHCPLLPAKARHQYFISIFL